MLSISAPATSAGLPPQDDILANAAMERGQPVLSLPGQRPVEIIGRLLDSLARHGSGEYPLSRADLMRLLVSLAAMAGVSRQPDEGLRIFTLRIATALEAMLPAITGQAERGQVRASSADVTDRPARHGLPPTPAASPDSRAARPAVQPVAPRTTIPATAQTAGVQTAGVQTAGAQMAAGRILPSQGPVLTPAMLQALVVNKPISDPAILQVSQIAEPRRKQTGTSVASMTEEEGRARAERGPADMRQPRAIAVPANSAARLPQPRGAENLPVFIAKEPLNAVDKIEVARRQSPQPIAEQKATHSFQTDESVRPSRLATTDSDPAPHRGNDATAERTVAAEPRGDVSPRPDSAAPRTEGPLRQSEGHDAAEARQSHGPSERSDAPARFDAPSDRAAIEPDGTYRITSLTEEMLAETGLMDLFVSESGAAERARASDSFPVLPALAEDAPSADGEGVSLPESERAKTLSERDLTLLDEAERAASAESDAGTGDAARRPDGSTRAGDGRHELHGEARPDMPRPGPQLMPSFVPMPMPVAVPVLLPTDDAQPSDGAARAIDATDEDGGAGDPDRQDSRGESEDEPEEETEDEAEAPRAYDLYRLLADQV